MDLYRSPDGRVWDIGALGRRYVGHPDVVHAYEASGRDVQLITAAGLATIPRLPDTGLPAWVLVPEPPARWIGDVPLLAAAIAALLPSVPDLTAAVIADAVADELARRMGTS